MKTKLLRFNKLPRIQTLPSKNMEHTQDPNFLGSVANFRQESLRSSDLHQLLDTLQKKNRASTTQYQPRDRTAIIDLPDLDETEQLPNDVLKMWIAEVCYKVISSSFNLLSTDALSYQQTKVSCSEGILRNIVLLMEKYRLSKQQIKIINEHIEKDVINYLKRKYPMTESTDVNKALDEAVKPIDKTEALDNDMLQKCDVVFTYRENGNYNSLIMEFLNWIMTEIDSKEAGSQKTVYEGFFNNMSKIFENVYNEKWMNRKARESIKDLPGVSLADVERTNKNITEQINEKYADQVKEYTNYIIGRKISKSVPTYTAEQIKEGHLMIKSPAILRILTKWCDQLWSKFKKKNYFLDREENVRVQEKGGNANTMFMWMKIPLNDLVENEKANIEKFMSEIQENNFDQQTELLRQELFENDGFYHVERIEKVCGKFATKTVNNLHSYIVLYLNRLIHGLLSVSKELYETKLSTSARWTSPPNLVTFKIGDLMRCKCSSKEREILQIYKQLQSISQSDAKTLKIIRVKNRLKLGTNDILINILYKNKYLCEIQLAVKSAQSKFIACSNKFNHYIYELGRTLFGPLTELSSVWMSLDPRAGEYQYIIENEKERSLPETPPCKSADKQHELVPHVRPFICSNCSLSFSHTNYFWNHLKCKVDGCNYVICALCRIKSEDKQRLKKRLLQTDQQLLNACTEIVNRKKEYDQRIPEYGICIPIESKRVVIQKFKKIQHKKIMTIFGLKKDKGQEKVFMIEELLKRSTEKNFLKKYIVFEIPLEKGEKLIPITIERAKKEFMIPQKVKQIYKKQKEIMSLIEENLTDDDISIIKGPVSGMELIKDMELADNCFTSIQFIVDNFPSLERLQLSRNKIANIDSIANLRFIRKLNLRNNKLKELPEELCYLDHLEGLNIRSNEIKALPSNFGNLKLLQKLQSDNNKIADLPESFKYLSKLTFINLSKNKLTSFPDSIRGFTELKELYLSKNKLKTIPEWIGEFNASMITLDLSKTESSNFPEGIYELKKLQNFKIESMHNILSPKIGNLQSLNQLHIQMPNVVKLPEEIFNLKQLETLVIEGCKINQMPDCLSEMKNLVTFCLINNNLDNISKEITEMTRLKNLSIEGQNISSLPDGFENLVSLRTLSLNNNKFTQFPTAVLKFSKLYKLQIKTNNLAFIPDNISEFLPELEEIILDENQLKKLPLSLQTAKKLKVLSINKNNNIEKAPWIKAVYELIRKNTADDTTMIKKTPSLGLEELVKSISQQ